MSSTDYHNERTPSTEESDDQPNTALTNDRADTSSRHREVNSLRVGSLVSMDTLLDSQSGRSNVLAYISSRRRHASSLAQTLSDIISHLRHGDLALGASSATITSSTTYVDDTCITFRDNITGIVHMISFTLINSIRPAHTERQGPTLRRLLAGMPSYPRVSHQHAPRVYRSLATEVQETIRLWNNMLSRSRASQRLQQPDHDWHANGAGSAIITFERYNDTVTFRDDSTQKTYTVSATLFQSIMYTYADRQQLPSHYSPWDTPDNILSSADLYDAERRELGFWPVRR
jgi:hypothetical protein